MFAPIDLMQKGLEASWLRNTVIRNNIANVETPGFKASDVKFESLLAAALEDDEDTGFVGTMTHEKHIEIGKSTLKKDVFEVEPRVVKTEGLSIRMDGNDVDIESENAKLAQNSIYYNTLVAKLNGELRRLKIAISEGK